MDGCPEGCHCDEATRCGEVYGTDDDQDDAGSCFTAYRASQLSNSNNCSYVQVLGRTFRIAVKWMYA